MITERRGEPLTFSRLADEAQVSRRTLYTHWGSIERVIGEAVALHTAEITFDPTGLEPQELLRRLLLGTRSRLTDPVTHLALTSLVAQASSDVKAAEVLAAMSTERLDEYNELLGPINHAQYSQIVGPLFFSSIVLGEEITDEFIESQVQCGLRILAANES
jgi:AcrR family transcriptional regulator